MLGFTKIQSHGIGYYVCGNVAVKALRPISSNFKPVNSDYMNKDMFNKFFAAGGFASRRVHWLPGSTTSTTEKQFYEEWAKYQLTLKLKRMFND